MAELFRETFEDLRDWRTWVQIIASIIVFLGINVCGYATFIVNRGW